MRWWAIVLSVLVAGCGDEANQNLDATDGADDGDGAVPETCGNGVLDPGEECDRDLPRACTTECGSTGFRACVACRWARECSLPTETCNDIDDDCDGVTDNGFACHVGETVTCTTTCGSAGTGLCTSACAIPAGGDCHAPTETCNGRDDDCDTTCDDGFACCSGQPTDCTTTCGSTGTGTCSETCGTPAPAACVAPAESCNGQDDDCDTVVDEADDVPLPPCLATQACCDGECKDVASDAQNCGECGTICEPALEACVGGACTCTGGPSPEVCDSGQTCCLTGCVDLLTDGTNCGACGARCGGLPCDAGRCACGPVLCPSGYSCCDSAAGLCFDLATDMSNCGSCGMRCDPVRSSSCTDRTCMCGSVEQCPSGTTEYPLCHMAPVTPPHRCCSGGCVRIDDLSCARCGEPCATGTECTASTSSLGYCDFSCEVPSG